MTELPKKIIVNRIPYSVCNSNDPYSYEADPGVQEIRVTQEAAPARKRQYFMWEVAHLLLVSAGMSQKEADRYHAGVDISPYLEGIADRLVSLVNLADCKGHIARNDLDKAVGHVDVISGTVSQFYNFLANEPKEGKGICLPKD